MLRFDVAQLLLKLASVSPRVQDLVFAVGRPPLVTVDGAQRSVKLEGLDRLTTFHTEMIALHLLAAAPHAARAVRDRGAASFTFPVPGASRFRVSVFQQRGSYAVVLRTIPEGKPRLDHLGLTQQLAGVAELTSGIVLVNGPTGSGRSTTIAALIEEISHTRTCHIITVEQPIEFLHRHEQALVHQREVGTDTPSLEAGLDDALQLGAEVLVVSEIPDAGVAALALEAAETGHLVIASLRGLDTGSALRRLVSMFESEARETVCHQLARVLRFSLTQALLPKSGGGRVLATEIWRNLPTTRELLDRGELGSLPIADALRDAAPFGTMPFDLSLERLVRAGAVTREVAMGHAIAPRQLELRLLDVAQKGA